MIERIKPPVADPKGIFGPLSGEGKLETVNRDSLEVLRHLILADPLLGLIHGLDVL